MRLRYGVNIGSTGQDLASGPAREELMARIRVAGSGLVRVFLTPSHEPEDWRNREALLEVLRQTGATPMIAVSVPEPWNDASALEKFAGSCGEFAAHCVDRWGREEVASWFWSIGDKPNSPWTNGGLTFEGYREIYEATASAIRQQLGPLDGRPQIGGPCIDGFQPFWFDWMWRFLEEVDDSLIGFAAWNRYGDWREPGAWLAPADPQTFERLLLSRTVEYWSRAEAVGQALAGRGILNICSELNAHPHPDPAISSRFNAGRFGAAYYASALIELMRGGADGECLWTGGCDPADVYEAKKLIARNVRLGDRICFPLDADPEPGLDAVIASGEADRRAAVLVHRSAGGMDVERDRWPALGAFSRATLICGGQEGPARSCPAGDILRFDGYGVMLLHDHGEM